MREKRRKRGVRIFPLLFSCDESSESSEKGQEHSHHLLVQTKRSKRSITSRRKKRARDGQRTRTLTKNQVQPRLVPNLDVDHYDILEWLVSLVASSVLDSVDHVETRDGSTEDAVGGERKRGIERRRDEVSVEEREEGEMTMRERRDSRVLIVQPGCRDGGDEKLRKKEMRERDQRDCFRGKKRREEGRTNLRSVRLRSSCERASDRAREQKHVSDPIGR